uniref:Secreted protein n=1 Tax=Arundo donax TaxID=35708 RepID=A0A0A9GFW8_ARUDO
MAVFLFSSLLVLCVRIDLSSLLFSLLSLCSALGRSYPGAAAGLDCLLEGAVGDCCLSVCLSVCLPLPRSDALAGSL